MGRSGGSGNRHREPSFYGVLVASAEQILETWIFPSATAAMASFPDAKQCGGRPCSEVVTVITKMLPPAGSGAGLWAWG